MKWLAGLTEAEETDLHRYLLLVDLTNDEMNATTWVDMVHELAGLKARHTPDTPFKISLREGHAVEIKDDKGDSFQGSQAVC